MRHLAQLWWAAVAAMRLCVGVVLVLGSIGVTTAIPLVPIALLTDRWSDFVPITFFFGCLWAEFWWRTWQAIGWHTLRGRGLDKERQE